MSYYSKNESNFLDASVLIYENPIETDAKDQFLTKVNAAILCHLDDEEFKSIPLSQEMGVSRSQLFRKIKAYTGFSTALYIRHIRLQKSKDLLKDADFPIRIVAYAVGFKDVAYFSKCFKQTFGCNPSQFRSETLQITV